MEAKKTIPGEQTLRAVLDALDIGVALVGSDHRLDYCNIAYAELLGIPVIELLGTSLFGPACPSTAILSYQTSWDEEAVVALTGEGVNGGTVEIVAQPLTPGSDLRLVVVRRGLTRTVRRPLLDPAIVEDMLEFLTELTGHEPDISVLTTPPISIVMIAIESLGESDPEKPVEETLRMVAEALVLQKRKADIITRYTDDRFLVIAPETPRRGAVMLADRIEASVQTLEIPVRVRTYAAEFRPPMDGTLRDAVGRASEALSEGLADEAH